MSTTAELLFDDPWSERDVINAVVQNPRSPVFYRKMAAVIPNASFGAGLDWEADLLCCSPRGVVTEVEVKVTRSDFIADRKKQKHAMQLRGAGMIAQFYYALPAWLWAKCQDVWRPEGAGVIAVGERRDEFDFYRPVEVVVPAVKRSDARRLDSAAVVKLQRLVMLRYWSRGLC